MYLLKAHRISNSMVLNTCTEVKGGGGGGGVVC